MKEQAITMDWTKKYEWAFQYFYLLLILSLAIFFQNPQERTLDLLVAIDVQFVLSIILVVLFAPILWVLPIFLPGKTDNKNEKSGALMEKIARILKGVAIRILALIGIILLIVVVFEILMFIAVVLFILNGYFLMSIGSEITLDASPLFIFTIIYFIIVSGKKSYEELKYFSTRKKDGKLHYDTSILIAFLEVMALGGFLFFTSVAVLSKVSPYFGIDLATQSPIPGEIAIGAIFLVSFWLQNRKTIFAKPQDSGLPSGLFYYLNIAFSLILSHVALSGWWMLVILSLIFWRTGIKYYQKSQGIGQACCIHSKSTANTIRQ